MGEDEEKDDKGPVEGRTDEDVRHDGEGRDGAEGLEVGEEFVEG